MNPRLQRAIVTPAAALPAGQATGVITTSADTCPRLPSSNSAYDFLAGVPGAWVKLVRDMCFRAALMATGMFIVGARGPKLLAYSLAGSAVVEGAVLFIVDESANPRGLPR